MKTTIVGTGYVGLVTATCLADAGNHVVGVDIDAEKVSRLSAGQCPIYEPGLEELLKANLEAGRLRMTTDLAEGVNHGNIVFIAVGTPPAEDGSADLSGVETIVRDIASCMSSAKVIVIKSTVPVGTGRRMAELMEELTAHPYAVVSNPEFLREGAAIDDFLHPDRLIIGAADPEAEGESAHCGNTRQSLCQNPNIGHRSTLLFHSRRFGLPGFSGDWKPCGFPNLAAFHSFMTRRA